MKAMSTKRPVVMITGATQYTGLTCAKVFAKSGYDIVITSRDAVKGGNAAKSVRDIAPDAFSSRVRSTARSLSA